MHAENILPIPHSPDHGSRFHKRALGSGSGAHHLPTAAAATKTVCAGTKTKDYSTISPSGTSGGRSLLSRSTGPVGTADVVTVTPMVERKQEESVRGGAGGGRSRVGHGAVEQRRARASVGARAWEGVSQAEMAPSSGRGGGGVLSGASDTDDPSDSNADDDDNDNALDEDDRFYEDSVTGGSTSAATTPTTTPTTTVSSPHSVPLRRRSPGVRSADGDISGNVPVVLENDKKNVLDLGGRNDRGLLSDGDSDVDRDGCCDTGSKTRNAAGHGVPREETSANASLPFSSSADMCRVTGGNDGDLPMRHNRDYDHHDQQEPVARLRGGGGGKDPEEGKELPNGEIDESWSLVGSEEGREKGECGSAGTSVTVAAVATATTTAGDNGLGKVDVEEKGGKENEDKDEGNEEKRELKDDDEGKVVDKELEERMVQWEFINGFLEQVQSALYCTTSCIM